MIEIKLGDFNIFLSKRVLSDFVNYKQDKIFKNESGGILLGQVFIKNIYILKNSVPCRDDKSKRYSFERDIKNAQKIIDFEFKESEGKTIYLGEWHTHPEKVPNPSSQDIKMIKEQFEKNILNEPFIVMIIFGTKSFFIGIYNGKKIISKKITWIDLYLDDM
ncbi:MAG: Mov34/MPN/PAD-1 family protein [Flavobacterium sp.]|uniref:Mov34/MPN/PAD-1 family protein n=1 Tax=Flavobacterium sp. TaxID=239 RepID=UPI001B2C752A|nr:Mov34/MPN/PAD-1 family protein [Flavobacterium sp.]MBO9583113.1 Mov34/MPN/PAD-1 family protein [Flavobacterium sp.]